MNKTKLMTHVVGIATLACMVVFIDIAENLPRILPAFHQLLFPVLLGLLILALPISAWQCRHRVKDLVVVPRAYAAAVIVLLAESTCAMSVFNVSVAHAALSLICIGLSYGVLYLCVVKLAEKRLWLAVTTFLLFAGTGIADLYRANSFHGDIHWILAWAV
jgi:hypothetical protein